LGSDLVIQVTNAPTPQPIPTAGTQNAPATQAAVNVNPMSEAVLQEVIVFLGANPLRSLADFSVTELAELQRVINATVAANPGLIGANAAATIANIRNTLAPTLGVTILNLANSSAFITVFSTSLPGGTANVPYNQTVLAIGSPGALSYALAAGSSPLPPGLSLNGSTGQITGTPTAAGTFNFTIQVGLPASPPSPVTQPLSIAIAPPPPAEVVSLTPPTVAIQVNAQSSLTVSLNVAQLTATTVTLSANAGGIVTLPATVQVPANQISVTFTITGQAVGTTQVTATIGTTSASSAVTVSLAPPMLVLPAQTLPPATVNVPYSHQLVATGGTAPFTWSPILILVGLPPGLTLSPSGLLSGTPTTAGTPNFTVQVQDAGIPMQTASRTLSLTIAPPTALNLTGTWISNYQCTGTGGTFSGQDTLAVTQTGTTVTFTLQPGGGLFTGTLIGNTMSYSGSGPGYTESGTWTMQGANNFTKTSNYVNTDGTGGSCPGTGQRLPFTLTVIVTGNGRVDDATGGIFLCGQGTGDCTQGYASGAQVTLSATGNAPGVAFNGWAANCGADIPSPFAVRIVMNSNKTCTASFGP
ncbi:MAG: Ig domain-containing protein, partial [Burkholderiales bacterium]